MNGLKVSIVIVSYNGEEYLSKCLKSVENSISDCSITITVVDNNSTDDTQRILKEHPGINVILNAKNIGFGKANNAGILQEFKSNKPDYIFLLNQDAYIEQNTVEILVEIMERNKKYGILSPLHMTGDGNGLDYDFSNYIVPANCPNLYSDLVVRKVNSLYEVDYVNAAAWLISSSCVSSVGLFEPMFEHYGEDNNYAQRCKQNGFSIGVTPKSKIYHDRQNRKKIDKYNRNYNRVKADALSIVLDPNRKFGSTYSLKIAQLFILVLKHIIPHPKYALLELRCVYFLLRNIKRLHTRTEYYKKQNSKSV